LETGISVDFLLDVSVNDIIVEHHNDKNSSKELKDFLENNTQEEIIPSSSRVGATG
jgi:hypothetical protein